MSAQMLFLFSPRLLRSNRQLARVCCGRNLVILHRHFSACIPAMIH
jgi:hypothetical protein